MRRRRWFENAGKVFAKSDEDNEDPLLRLFGGGSEEEEEEEEQQPGFKFGTEEDVPEELRGKDAKEALKLLEETKKAAKESQERLNALEKSLKESEQKDKDSDGTEAEMIDFILESKVRKLIGDDPVLAKHVDDILAVANQITDPKVRMKNSSLELVLNTVRGQFVKEYMGLTEKKIPGTVVEGSAVGDGEMRTERRGTKLSQQQQQNLSAWYDGDMTSAKNSLLGGKS